MMNEEPKHWYSNKELVFTFLIYEHTHIYYLYTNYWQNYLSKVTTSLLHKGCIAPSTGTVVHDFYIVPLYIMSQQFWKYNKNNINKIYVITKHVVFLQQTSDDIKHLKSHVHWKRVMTPVWYALNVLYWKWWSCWWSRLGQSCVSTFNQHDWTKTGAITTIMTSVFPSNIKKKKYRQIIVYAGKCLYQ